MREIKFRACFQGKMNYDYQDTTDVDLFGFTDSEYFKIMQYTGLKDKNGKEIYENDIVQGKLRGYEWVIPQKVTFWNGCFMFGNWNAHEYFNKHTEITVLGNAYENPELLEPGMI